MSTVHICNSAFAFFPPLVDDLSDAPIHVPLPGDGKACYIYIYTHIYTHIYNSMFIDTRSSLTIVKRCEEQIQRIAHMC